MGDEVWGKGDPTPFECWEFPDILLLRHPTTNSQYRVTRHLHGDALTRMMPRVPSSGIFKQKLFHLLFFNLKLQVFTIISMLSSC